MKQSSLWSNPQLPPTDTNPCDGDRLPPHVSKALCHRLRGGATDRAMTMPLPSPRRRPTCPPPIEVAMPALRVSSKGSPVSPACGPAGSRRPESVPTIVRRLPWPAPPILPRCGGPPTPDTWRSSCARQLQSPPHLAVLLFFWASRPRAEHTPMWCRLPAAPLRVKVGRPRRFRVSLHLPPATANPCLSETCWCEPVLRLPDRYVPQRSLRANPRRPSIPTRAQAAR